MKRITLLGVAIVPALALMGCGGSGDNGDSAEATTTVTATATTTPSAEAMTVAGAIQLKDQYYAGSATKCDLREGYEDFKGGAEVTVYDADGTALALGSTDSGTPGQTSRTQTQCLFTFKVEDVPAEGEVFSVEVGHRGRVNFTKENSEMLMFSLG